MALRTNNPILNDKFIRKLPAAVGEPMTINGTIARAGLMLVLMLITGWWTWNRFMAGVSMGDLAAGAAAVQPFLWGGLIGGFILALACAFKPTWTPVTAPLYAIAEGAFLGAISAMFEVQYHGIVMEAILASAAVMAVMLFLYRSGIIKVTQKFRMGVIAATGGIALLYLVAWGVGSFTHYNMGFVYGAGTMGLVLSVVFVCVAALNLVLDFDLIERASAQGAPKYMEWYCAFGLMVTLVWLYIQMLQLLASSRR